MRRLQRCLTLVLAAISSAPALFAGGAIAWSPEWEAALARAAAEKKVVFIAVNMDDEIANDRLAQKVYVDERVVRASEFTVNLIASRFDHSPDDRPCSRFGGIECIQHKRIEGAVRQNVLKSDSNGYVVAPQHVFVGPDQKVLLSVPYEITAEELQWCFSAALKLVDPAAAAKVPATGRPPRRLIQGDVFDSGAVPGASLAPPSREQVLELIKELRASMWGADRPAKLLRVLLSPEPEAVEFIGQEMKNDLFGRRGWVNPGGPNGDPKDRLMHTMGVLSPAPYWKVAADYVDDEDLKLRNEAIVALEQLAVPESVKAIQTALNKEKLPKLRKDLVRALASAGASDDKVRKSMLKLVAGEKDELVRRCAIVGLGWLAPNDEVAAALSKTLVDGKFEERCAAAVAMGLSRHEPFAPELEKALAAEQNPDFKPFADAALSVLKGAGLPALRTSVRQLCEDELEREKFFGPGG